MNDAISRLEAVVAKIERAVQQLTLASAGGSRSSSSSSDGGARFPNYGKKKGEPVRGADLGDLKFYARGCERTLNDESKAKWHDKERALLEAIHAEMRRQGHAPDYGDSSMPPPDDGPPPPDDWPATPF